MVTKMTKRRIIDFNDDFSAIQSKIQTLSKELKIENERSNQTKISIEKLENELKTLGINYNSTNTASKYFDDKKIHNYSNEYFSNLYAEVEKNVVKEVSSNHNLLPSLTKLDYLFALTIGTIGVIIDMLFVKIPHNITYLGKYKQSGSEITNWLKTFGINHDGKLNNFLSNLEKTNKVSFDASSKRNLENYNRDVSGFYPKTHRLMSLGHDPFYGLIFGLLDILNGTVTLIDSKGSIHNVALEKYQNKLMKDKLFAPVLWIGHILSDICTKMGVPVPGWGFTQLLQFGSFGENDKTIADLARYMYIEGYDLRHFLNMGTVPSSIELCTRIYYQLTIKKEEFFSPVYSKEIRTIHNNIRLQKLLFTAHSVATNGNLIKIILHRGNPLSFNVAQMLGFIKQSVQMAQIELRDRTAEKIIRNREKINGEWRNF